MRISALALLLFILTVSSQDSSVQLLSVKLPPILRPTPDCRLILCPYGYTCVDGKGCVEKNQTGPNCALIKCAAGYTCINGTGCVKNNDSSSCAAVLCPVGTVCKNGQCYKNPNSTCGLSGVCTEGYCMPSICRPCPRGAQCFVGPTCPGGFRCENNQCVRDCETPYCPPGRYCIQSIKCYDIADGIQKCDF